MIEALLVYLGLAVFIGIFAVQEDRHHKKIADGFNPSARDGDKDGIVQDGTKWERKVEKKWK